MNRERFLIFLLLLAMAIGSAMALRAQDNSPLRPPKGHKLALVVFEDLQCPDCARAAPLLEEAARTYKIPLVRYDFPLPRHSWAFEAAVLARYFGEQSKELEESFREYVFRNQAQITPENLRGMAERFALQHKVELPFLLDPKGQLAAAVKADRDLGQRIGVAHTPTIYVVTSKKTGTPFVEVVDRSQLFAMIDQMRREN